MYTTSYAKNFLWLFVYASAKTSQQSNMIFIQQTTARYFSEVSIDTIAMPIKFCASNLYFMRFPLRGKQRAAHFTSFINFHRYLNSHNDLCGTS